MSQSETAVRVIKKYPNRRLYDTETSAYITLADVKSLVTWLASEDGAFTTGAELSINGGLHMS